MNGVHVIWTKPKGGTVFKTDYELLTAALSALEWRKHNGSIAMLTDNTDYFKKSGLGAVWNEVKSLHVDSRINPETFWAAGKIYAMKQTALPFCMIDTDFVVWEKLDFEGHSLAAIHEEELLSDIYPDYPAFFDDSHYSRYVNPVNTAFTYINNSDFLRLYTEEAMRFMINFPETKDSLRPMIFAEQRMFSMCAERLNIRINLMSDIHELFDDNRNKSYTHLWGFKGRMESDNVLRYDYRSRVLARINKDFPEYCDIVKTALDYYL